MTYQELIDLVTQTSFKDWLLVKVPQEVDDDDDESDDYEFEPLDPLDQADAVCALDLNVVIIWASRAKSEFQALWLANAGVRSAPAYIVDLLYSGTTVQKLPRIVLPHRCGVPLPDVRVEGSSTEYVVQSWQIKLFRLINQLSNEGDEIAAGEQFDERIRALKFIVAK